MEDFDLMMKIIVVGDGRVSYLCCLITSDRKDLFDNSLRQKCVLGRIQEDSRG